MGGGSGKVGCGKREGRTGEEGGKGEGGEGKGRGKREG